MVPMSSLVVVLRKDVQKRFNSSVRQDAENSHMLISGRYLSHNRVWTGKKTRIFLGKFYSLHLGKH